MYLNTSSFLQAVKLTSKMLTLNKSGKTHVLTVNTKMKQEQKI